MGSHAEGNGRSRRRIPRGAFVMGDSTEWRPRADWLTS
jgi:hypothetical protein